MNSYNVLVHNDTGQQQAREKKAWIKPVLEVVGLESAEAGGQTRNSDSTGHFSKTRS